VERAVEVAAVRSGLPERAANAQDLDKYFRAGGIVGRHFT